MPADPREVLTRPAPAPDLTVRYGDHPDQVADLRVPGSGSTSRPLLVLVHGGFWRAEYDRAHTGPLAAALAARGWPVAQVEYRRTGQPGGGWPGTFADVAAALTLLPALARDAGVVATPEPPVVVGHSAGGQLALWWAASAPVRGVVALAPVADLTEAYRRDLDDGAVVELLGGSPTQVPHRYAYATPGSPGSPAVIVHGQSDVQVPVELSRAWCAATGVELRELPDTEHFGLIDPKSDAWPTVVAAIERISGN